MKALDKQLEALGLNPTMFGFEVEELTDVSPERAQKYEEQRGAYRRAVQSWMSPAKNTL